MKPSIGTAWREMVPPGQRGWICAFLALLIWSIWPVWTRHGVTQGLSPEDIVFLRFGIGGLIFFPFLLLQARKISRRGWAIGFGLALCQGAPFVLMMATGLRFAPASHAASIATGASPIFAALIAASFFNQPVAKARWLGLMLVIGGTALLALAGADGHAALGDLFFLGAAAMAAMYVVCVPRSGLTAFQAAAMVCVFSMLLYVPVYFLFDLGHLPQAHLGDVVAHGAYQGVLVAVVSFLLFNGAIGFLGSARVSALCALVPLFTLALAIPILGEWPSQVEITSAVLIAAGVSMAAFAARLRRPALE